MRCQTLTVTQRLDRAIQQEQQEIFCHPTAPDWRLCRRTTTWVVAETMARSGDHMAAAQAAIELARDCDAGWPEDYDAACIMSRCVELALGDSRMSEREKSRWAHRYALRAVKLLKSAIKKGLPVKRLARDPDLQPLRRYGAITALAGSRKSRQRSSEPTEEFRILRGRARCGKRRTSSVD